MVATILLIVLIIAGWLINNRAVIVDTAYTVTTRMEPIEETLRNVNAIMRTLRSVYGDEAFRGNIPVCGEPPDSGGGGGPDDGSIDTLPSDGKGGIASWLRSADQELWINEEMARSAVRMFKAVQGILSQTEESHTIEVVTGTVQHVDGIMTSPQIGSLIDAMSQVVQHPDANAFAAQTVAILSHLESAILPVLDVLAGEIRAEIERLMEAAEEDGAHDLFREWLLEVGDVVHKAATGFSDIVVWYRNGGPQNAVMLTNDLILVLRDLVESPAAASLVVVLESIDWKETGHELHQTAMDVKAIVRTVREANTVEAVDQLMRAVGRVLADPATSKAVALLPGVVANATALLAKNSSQHMIAEASLMFQRLEAVLGQAEIAHAVERSAAFMGALQRILWALVQGGLHVELGELPNRVSGDGDDSASTTTTTERKDRGKTPGTPQIATSSSSSSSSSSSENPPSSGFVLPHYQGIEPETDRRQRQQQRRRPRRPSPSGGLR